MTDKFTFDLPTANARHQSGGVAEGASSQGKLKRSAPKK
jgi:hypothetical protein